MFLFASINLFGRCFASNLISYLLQEIQTYSNQRLFPATELLSQLF